MKSTTVDAVPSPTLVQPRIWTRAFALAKGALVALAVSLFLNVVLSGLAVALAFRPADVIMVDKLGEPSFIPAAESRPDAPDYEVEAFARTWTSNFLSQDGVSAKEDFARALSLVHPSLQMELRKRFVDSGLLQKIADAFVRSVVSCDKIAIEHQSASRIQVTVSGTRRLMPMGGGAHQVATEPYALTLVLQRVPRTAQTIDGLVVRYIASAGNGEPFEVGSQH